VPDFESRFDDVLETLRGSPEWKTARTTRPVLILGSIDGVEVGYRRPIRKTPIQTVRLSTRTGDIVVPSLREMIGIKAYLAYARNATRDYLDFAALTTCATDDEVASVLWRLDELYEGVQQASVRLEVSKALSSASPFDLEGTDLTHYKGLAVEWQDWKRVAETCRRFGVRLAEKLVLGGGD
jgi:hypothetical protein